MYKHHLVYYKLVGDTLVEDTSVPITLLSSNIRKSSEPKSNSAEFTLSNPIVDFFADGTPRRLFTDTTGNNTFRATATTTGHLNFEERIEIFAKEVSDINEDIVDDSNLIFAGQIKEVEVVHEEKKATIRLTTTDRTFNILNRIMPGQYTDTSINIVQRVIRQSTEASSNKATYFDENGVKNGSGKYKYFIDARTFTQGLKQTATISSINGRTITLPSVTATVKVGDLIKNNENYRVALVKEINGTTLTVSKKIFAAGDSISISDGFMQDWRPDGSAFPTIQFGFGNKPIIEWITNLTQTENTNTAVEKEGQNTLVCKRPLLFYVDGFNRLHIFYPDNNPTINCVSGAITPVEDDLNIYKIHKVKLKRGVFDIINFVIFKAGEDMAGNGVSWYAQDPSAGGPLVKDCFKPFPSIAERMKAQAYIAGQTPSLNEYPTTYGAGLVPAWSSSGTTVTSDATYNTEFRKEARLRGVARAKDLINQTATPRWQGTVDFGFFNFNPSDLMQFTDKEIGVNRINLRIKEVQHNFQTGGFFTTLTLKEDLLED